MAYIVIADIVMADMVMAGVNESSYQGTYTSTLMSMHPSPNATATYGGDITTYIL